MLEYNVWREKHEREKIRGNFEEGYNMGQCLQRSAIFRVFQSCLVTGDRIFWHEISRNNTEPSSANAH